MFREAMEQQSKELQSLRERLQALTERLHETQRRMESIWTENLRLRKRVKELEHAR